MAMGIWRIRLPQKIMAPVRMGTMVISAPSPRAAWSATIWRASWPTRSAMRSREMRMRSMSACILLLYRIQGGKWKGNKLLVAGC